MRIQEGVGESIADAFFVVKEVAIELSSRIDSYAAGGVGVPKNHHRSNLAYLVIRHIKSPIGIHAAGRKLLGARVKANDEFIGIRLGHFVHWPILRVEIWVGSLEDALNGKQNVLSENWSPRDSLLVGYLSVEVPQLIFSA